MLAYAASRPVSVERRPYPNAMLVIIAIHVAVIAAVMSAKMDLPRIFKDPHTTIFWVPKPVDPPPPAPSHETSRPQPTNHPTTVTRTDPQVPLTLPHDDGALTGGPGETGPGPVAMNFPPLRPTVHEMIKYGPSLLTSGEDLKPPYPSSKLLTEEEAVLTLRLSIDERGRVVAVEPVGRTDRVFFEAARRHLLARWRYKPATEDGHPVASTAVITLRFQLDG